MTGGMARSESHIEAEFRAVQDSMPAQVRVARAAKGSHKSRRDVRQIVRRMAAADRQQPAVHPREVVERRGVDHLPHLGPHHLGLLVKATMAGPRCGPQGLEALRAR